MLFLFGGVLYGERKPPPSHMDSYKNPLGCGACHSGKGAPGTPLLRNKLERLCFDCHGAFSRGSSKKDVETVFSKRSIHPIHETTKYHISREDLPERLPSISRHVACADCHVAHLSSVNMPWAGAKGYKRGGVRGRRADNDYELCYLCHSDSANLPSGATNKKDEFDPFNESYHPVELVGRNKFVPSLVRGLTINSIIRCTSCHGNNDPLGAKGPHGSDYEPILMAEYRTYEGVESPKTYELCYMCHDRRSILGDESFRKHNLHITIVRTSCYTCHNSHGVQNTKHLISFNPSIVSVSNTGLPITYLFGTPPQCTLRCHGADHQINIGVYPPLSNIPMTW